MTGERLIFAHGDAIRPGEFTIFRVVSDRGIEVEDKEFAMQTFFEGTITDLTDSLFSETFLKYLAKRGDIVFMYNPADEAEFEGYLGAIDDGEGDE